MGNSSNSTSGNYWFSIIIPILDPFDRLVSASAIQGTLLNVLALEGAFELIIVNNNPIASCPRLTRYLRSLSETDPNRIKIVEPDTNLGTARGFNAGLYVADPGTPYLVFMSSDADIVDMLMLRRIQELMDSNPGIGIAHPISVFEDSDIFNYSSKYGRKRLYRIIRNRFSVDTAEIGDSEIEQILKKVSLRSGIKTPVSVTPLTFAIFRREMLDRIGAFDEGIELGCHENNDLAYRALLQGYGVARLNAVFVNHRRLYFRNLVVGGTPEIERLPHSDALRQSTPWWNNKWGRAYVELYARWRWGRLLFALMLPYFWLRRVGGSFKRAMGR